MMQWALARANRNSMKIADGGVCMTSSKSVAPNSCNISSKDQEVAAITLNSPEKRYIVLTLVTLALDERCKIIAPFLLPLAGSDQINHLASEAHGKMDGLEPVPSNILVQVDLRGVQRSHLHPFSAKPFTSIHSSRSNIKGQVQNRLAAKSQSRVSKRSADSWQESFDSSNVSSGLSDQYSSSTSDSSNQVKDITKADKHGRSSRKKPKKKGKRNKKSPENVSPVSIEEKGIQDTFPCDAGDEVDAASVSADGLVVTSPNRKECALKEVLVDRDDRLPSEVCSATSKICSPDESSVAEESCTFVAQEFAAETLIRSVTRLKRNSCDGATSSLGSVQSTRQNVIRLESADRRISHGDVTVGHSTDGHDASISDPFWDGWDRANSLNGNGDVNNRLPSKEDHEISPLDSGVVSDGSNCSTSHTVSFGVGDLPHEKSCDLSQDLSQNLPDHLHTAPGDCSKISTDNAERIKCSSGSCSSTNEHEFVPGRKAKRTTKLAQGSSGIAHRFGGYTNTHARTGKENNHSVWQKVLRSNEDVPRTINCGQLPQDFAYESSSSCIRYDLGQRKSTQERSSRCASLYEMSAQDDSQKVVSDSVGSEDLVSKNMNSEKLNTKVNMGSKLEHNYQPMKSLPNRNGLVRPSKKKSFHTGATEVSKQSIHHRSSISATGYSHYVPCSRTDVDKADIIDSYNSFSIQDMQTDSAAAFPLVGTSHPTERAFEHEVKLGNGTIITKGLTQSVDLDPVNTYCRQISKTSNTLQISHDDRSNLELENVNVFKEQEVVSYQLDHISSIHAGLERFTTCKSSLPSCNALEQPEKSSNNITSMCSIDDTRVLATNNAHIGISPHGQERSVSEGVLYEMVEAVHDAYRTQVESEDVQLATGSHLAEFERVLHAASPMFSISTACNHGSSLCNKLSRDFLCKHQITDHTLRTLWQWYEEPGCYGLKVKVEDFQSSRRLGANLHESCAYFLPLLSAVQLFGHSSGSSSSSSHICSTELTDIPKAETSTSLTKFWHLPILSILLPKPLKVAATDDGELSPKKLSCTTKSSASSCCEGHNLSGNAPSCASCSDGSELIFEYFELERPPQRKPLFEKIKELVDGGNASSSAQMFGDPSYLVNLSLCDLHPASWFAVAWYPIYRIPEDSFRTAFLTYHSLGHFIHRSSSLDSSSEINSFVSPVVGLQRYNDQGECWFSLKEAMATSLSQDQPCDPSLILEKRVMTLEKAASVMSRASVCKGEGLTMNRHSDYEFFLSRRW